MLSSTCPAVICPPSAGKTACHGELPLDRPRAFCRVLTDVETVYGGNLVAFQVMEYRENIFKSSQTRSVPSVYTLAMTLRLLNSVSLAYPFFPSPVCNVSLPSNGLYTCSFASCILPVLPLPPPFESFVLRNKFGAEPEQNGSVNGPLFQVDLHFTLNELHIALLTQICERAACASRIPISDRPSVISGNFQKSPRELQ